MAVLVVATAAACDTGVGPDAAKVRLVMTPTFATMSGDQHEGEEAGGDPALRVDNVRVLIQDAEGAVVVDQVVAWPLDQDTLRVEVVVEVTGTQTFEFELEGREGDRVLFRAGPLPLELASGDAGPVDVAPVLEYAGPEASLVSVSITGPPDAFLAGSEVELHAHGLDEEGAEVDDPLVVWSSLDTLAARVDSAGKVQVRHDASRTARIVARLAFRTLADTLTLPVVPASLGLVPDTSVVTALGFDAELSADPRGVGGEPVAGALIDWSSRDPAAAVVVPGRETGPSTTIRAAREDTVWVVARSGPVEDSVIVIVRQRVTAAAPTPTRAILEVGDTLTVAVAPLDAGGSPIEGRTVTWSTTGTADIAVDADDVARAAGPGYARLLGEVEGEAYGLEVDVVDGVNAGPPSLLTVGDAHVCMVEALNSDIYCWGENDSGQLGIGTGTSAEDRPSLAANPHRAAGESTVAVAAGGLHTCSLLEESGTHRAFCWGDNRFGQLGDGTVSDRDGPVAVEGAVELVQLAAGGFHTCGLDAAGAAYCWGLDYFGQLGQNTAGDIPSLGPVPVSGGHTFTALAAGWLHTCGLATDGSAWCWGRGGEGELGTGALADAAVPVEVAGGHTFSALFAGAAHTCGIASGTLYCWGYNSSGQTGTGSAEPMVPTPLPVVLAESAPVSDAALGWIHGCALTDIGEVHCWGANDALQLGQALPRATRTPVAVPLGFEPESLEAGASRTCALDGSRMICWGGLPREYLGRDQLTPQVPDPLAAAFSRR